MLALVLAALRARRAQAVTLFLLTALAAASAAAAPWYVLASAEAVATRHVQTAPVRERVIEVRDTGPVPADLSITEALDAFGASVDGRLAMPGFTRFSGASVAGFARNTPDNDPNKRQSSSPLIYREAACEHVVIEGACPSAPDEVMMSSRTARFLRVNPGDTVYYQSFDLAEGALPLRVSGVYRPTNVAEAYWAGGTSLLATDVPTSVAPDVTEPIDDAVLITAGGLDKLKPKKVTAVIDRVANGSVFVETPPSDLLLRLNTVHRELGDENQTLDTSIGDLAKRVDRDQRLIYLGVPAGASQLLLLCWFALYLAVKYTGEERRPDIGLLKLRGARRRRIWALIAGQSAVPMLVGAALGVPVGYFAVHLLAGAISASDLAGRARNAAAGAAAVAVLGALVAALLAERKALGAGVGDLLRQVPSRGRAWRDIADLAIVVLAVAAVYQVRTRATGDTAGLALLAPGLAALAFALIAARAVTAFAGRLVPGALRAGRPALALTAIYLARRPGIHRLCALLLVTVALLGTSSLAWSAGVHSAAVRAEIEVGADRVLTVRADNRMALLVAVRDADPSGRLAMAAVESTSSGPDPVLLVDATRLAAVARWRPEYGMPTAAQAAAALHPPGSAPVMVTGGELAVEATLVKHADPRSQVAVEALLADGQGHRVRVRFGPLTASRQRFQQPVPTCTAKPNCRLVSFSVVESTDGTAFFPAREGVSVTLQRLDQSGPDGAVVEPAALADRVRWRATSSAAPANLVITSAPTGLVLTVARVTQSSLRDPGVYPMDSPVPLASIRAAPRAASAADAPTLVGDPRVAFGAITLPEHQVATATRLPRLGTAGVLMDLEYADRLGGDLGGADEFQVWLNAGAPSRIVDALRAKGLLILGDETLGAVANRYARLGPPLALRFTLGSSLVGLILAAGAVAVVAAVERRPRTAELAALRSQGAPARLTKRVAIGGYLVLIGVSLALGLLAALVMRAFIGDVIPFFADGWKIS